MRRICSFVFALAVAAAVAVGNPQAPVTRVNRLAPDRGQTKIAVDGPIEFTRPEHYEEFLNDVLGAMAPGGKISLDVVPVIDPTAHVAEAVDGRIEGLSVNAGTRNLFSVIEHATPSYAWNESAWCGDVDLTCLSVWNSDGGAQKAGVAISPRHVVFANHFPIANGATLRFVTRDNQVVTRTLTASAQVGTTDIRVGLLNADLPGTIRFAKVMPSGYAAFLTPEGLPVLKVDQERKALVSNVASEYLGERQVTAPGDAQRLSFHEDWVTADSGSPAFLVFDGRPVLYLLAHTASAGPELADHIGDINAVMSALGGGYTVTTVELRSQSVSWVQVSGKPSFGNAATITAAEAPSAGQIPLVRSDTNKLDVAIIPAATAAAVEWANVQNRPFTATASGSTGVADANKGAKFDALGDLTVTGVVDPANPDGTFFNRSSGFRLTRSHEDQEVAPPMLVINTNTNDATTATAIQGYSYNPTGYGVSAISRGGPALHASANIDGTSTKDIVTFQSGWADKLRVDHAGTFKLNRTITPGGTTGAVTSNKPAGTVNFAAGASTLTVTNSLVTGDSIIVPVVMTNDATAEVKCVVPAAGSFTIHLKAAATAQTRVGWIVTN